MGWEVVYCTEEEKENLKFIYKIQELKLEFEALLRGEK